MTPHAGTTITTAVESVDEVAEISGSLTSMWESFVEALPRVGVAAAAVLVVWLVARGVRAVTHRTLERGHTPSFATVMSKIAGWLVLALGVLFGLTIVFPSVAPVDLLAGLGIFSVAVGFAFQDILENLLAGILLLFREPFRSGDQVEVNGHIGTVLAITIRETRIRTFDGQLTLVPNADVYKNAIRVQTEFEQRRTDFAVGVAYEADLAEARRVIESALADTPGVSGDPAPEAFLTQLGAATIDFTARFWSDPRQLEALVVKDRAIEAVKVALDRAGVEMPADIVALQATSSFAAALRGERVTPGGSVEQSSG